MELNLILQSSYSFFSTIALFLSQRSSPPTAGSVPVFEALLGLGVITIQLPDDHHLHLQFADRALLSIIVLPSKPKRNKGSQARVILRHHLAQCPLQSSRVSVQLKWSWKNTTLIHILQIAFFCLVCWPSLTCKWKVGVGDICNSQPCCSLMKKRPLWERSSVEFL